MTADRLPHLIMENLPLHGDRRIFREDLRQNVKGDCESLGLTYSFESFDSSLQRLHDEQLVFIFQTGFVGLTGMGKFKLK